MLDEITGKFGDTYVLKIKIVCVYIKTTLVTWSEILFSILQQECRFPHTTCTFDANHAVIPVNFVHKKTSDRCIYMLYQIIVSSVKSFLHSWINVVLIIYHAKILFIFIFTNSMLQNIYNFFQYGIILLYLQT